MDDEFVVLCIGADEYLLSQLRLPCLCADKRVLLSRADTADGCRRYHRPFGAQT